MQETKRDAQNPFRRRSFINFDRVQFDLEKQIIAAYIGVRASQREISDPVILTIGFKNRTIVHVLIIYYPAKYVIPGHAA